MCAIFWRGSANAWAVVFFVVVGSIVAWPSSAVAVTPQPIAGLSAEELVNEALFSEIYGRDSHRRELLDEALSTASDTQAARWHSGQVRFDDDWVNIDQIPSLANSDPKYAEYLKVRPDYPDTVAGQLGLGVWCRKKRLNDQARAHFSRVLQMAPDHKQARAFLGYKLVQGVWITNGELQQFRDRSREVRKNLLEWKPRIEGIRRGLAHADDDRRQRALADLRAITEAEAIPALETVLAESSRQTGRLLVETLAQITDHQAAMALAGQAVFSPWQTVRTSAAIELRSRQFEAFVPTMLAAMYTPVVAQNDAYRRPNGRLVNRLALTREGRDVRELAVLETDYLDRVDLVMFTARPASIRDWRGELAMVGVQNDRTELLNQRIGDALNVITDQRLPDDPRGWWSWWDGRYDNSYGEKPVRTAYRREYRQSPRRSHSCFAAGTIAWTVDGPKPIEQIQIGDLVLSQHPDTGELAYKPVLRTTVGPAVKLLSMRAGSEKIDCTEGHLFWVSGSAWVQARHLSSGAGLHTVGGTVPVNDLGDGWVEPAHNLVVADFHTYFVGQSRILTHDVMPSGPTTTVVPGLKER